MSFSRNLKNEVITTWEECYNHPFVQGLGTGELDKDSFIFYLKQDYIYLLEYAKVFALGALKSIDEEMIRNFTNGQVSAIEELKVHKSYMEEFGVGSEECESTKASLFNNAYTANMLAVGYNEGIAELIATVLPCALTYYEFATRLKEDYSENLDSNFYKSWIKSYSSEEFFNSFQWMFSSLNDLCKYKDEKELSHIIFKKQERTY